MQTLASMLTSFEVPKGITFYDPAEDEQRELQRRKFERIKQSGIPKRFWDADLAQCQPAVMKWVSGVKEGGCAPLVLQGDVGNGKTYAACAAMISLMPEKRCQFTTFDGILDDLKAAFDGLESEKAIIGHLSAVPVLCIDDFGKEKPTEWSVTKLFKVINNRWGNKRPTIITTQYTGQKLMEKMTVDDDPESAKAVVSRLLNDAVVVKFHGKDRRLQ